MNKSIKSFEQATEYLGNRNERPLANNTRIERVADDMIAIKYHGHAVVTFLPQETIFSSCGWMTLTTKERINWSLPTGFRVYQECSVWYLMDTGESWDWQNAKRYIFQDGITIHADRSVTGNAPELIQDDTKKTIKRIHKFVEGYIKALLNGDVPAPGAGDCWYCSMVTTNGESLGDATNNNEHILSHMEESYFVPSMLTNAEKFNHRFCMLSKDGIARIWQGESISEWQQSVVARDVKSSLTNYLKHELGLANR